MRRDWAFWLSALTLGAILVSAVFAERLRDRRRPPGLRGSAAAGSAVHE